MDAVTKFRKALRAVEGVYYRRDKGLNTGRNAASTDATLAWRVEELQALVSKHDEVTDALDADQKLAARYQRVERRYYGLPT